MEVPNALVIPREVIVEVVITEELVKIAYMDNGKVVVTQIVTKEKNQHLRVYKEMVQVNKIIKGQKDENLHS